METIEARVCIVGAGPAGLTVARQCSNVTDGIVLLESGDVTDVEESQSLNEGRVTGLPYAGLRATRCRGIGGTTRTWNTVAGGAVGGKYVPLDPADFAAWPIAYEDLVPWYREAQSLCGLGDFDYSGTRCGTPERAPLDLGAGLLTTRVYQFGTASRWLAEHADALRASPGVCTLCRTTACELVRDGSRIAGVRARHTSTGEEVLIRAEQFVLAGGAIENARLLMASPGLAALPWAREDGWLGRGFMEHLRDRSMRLAATPGLFARTAFYDMHRAPDGTIVGGRLAPCAAATSLADVPNFSVTLLPHASPVGLTTRLARRLGWRRVHQGYGWSALARPETQFDGHTLLINLEQRPDRENRLLLAGERDALGVPRVELRLQWSDAERATLERLKRSIAVELGAAGVGDVLSEPAGDPDLNAHHHAGTTRMARSAADGVVDPDCRVFGLDNLYAAGASVFPTAGYANPALTIVALSARLAAHLRRACAA